MPGKTPSVPIGLRFGIVLVAIGLTFLLIWLLGFILDDVAGIRVPTRAAIESRHIDGSLVERSKHLSRIIEDLNRRALIRPGPEKA